MRSQTLLPFLVTALLVVAAAGTALAQGGRDGPRDHARGDAAQEHRADAANRTEGNASARAQAMQARHAELKAARDAALASFHENRSAALADFHAANNATRASFLENKTQVLESCRAARNASRADNATSGASGESKCVKDGLKPLIAKARAEHREHRETLQERLAELRADALKGFRAAKADADRRHGPRQDG